MLGSCPHCWDVLCCCGYMYKHWSEKSLTNLVRRLNKLIEVKQDQRILNDDVALMKELDSV